MSMSMSSLIEVVSTYVTKWYVIVPLIFILYKLFDTIYEVYLMKKFGAKRFANFETDGYFGFHIPFVLIKKKSEGTLIDFSAERYSKISRPDVPTLTFKIFNIPIVATKDPENIKAILATQFSDFSLGTRHAHFLPLLGDGIFTLDGQGWKDSRQMLRPQFAREQIAHVKMLEPHIQVFFKHVYKSKGQVFDIQELLFRLTVDSATEFLFGQSVESLRDASIGMQNDATEIPGTKEFAKAFNFSQNYLASRVVLQKFYWLLNGKKFRECNQVVHKFAQHYVRKALSLTAADLEKENGYIFLYELVKHTRDPKVLQDQLLNILVAGRDTTAGLLSFVFFELARNPNVFAKLKEELYNKFGSGKEARIDEITFESLKGCEYLKAVLNECLRLYPSVPQNFRIATRTTTLPHGGGKDGLSPILIRKGQNVIYSVFALHRDEKYYGKDANEFRPERWFEPETRKLGWAFVPFNGGPRICLGQQFALTEASYVVTRLIQEFGHLTMDPNTPYPPKKMSHLTLSLMSFQWSPDEFAEIYNAIKFQPDIDLSTLDFSPISTDLLHVLTTPIPSQESRNKLNEPVTLSNGDRIEPNQAFVEISGVLATELDLDEICTAELLYNAQEISFKKGTSLNDSAKLSYFLRDEYILNILGYLVSKRELNLDVEKVFDNVVASFDKIYKLVGNLNNMIDKQKVTGDVNNLVFINGVNFARVQLFKCHELLGSILFGLSQFYFDKIGQLKNYQKILTIVKSCLSSDDILVTHFIPFVLNFYQKAQETEIMSELYTHIVVKSIHLEKSETFDLSKSNLNGFEIVTSFVFLTQFIPWCKKQSQSQSKYDFQESIIKYMEQLISYGVMELLLSYCSETATQKTRNIFELSDTYDFRSLLQTSLPRMQPTKFTYPSSSELNNLARQRPGLENVKKLTDISFLKLNPEFNDSLIAPLFQTFFSTFISNAALILTSLRDSEEDFALSFQDRQAEDETSDDDSDNDDKKKKLESSPPLSEFDEIAQRADLERFYLAFAYTYDNRPELCSLFWSEEEITNEVVGFLSWGLSNNTSPLIVASFSVLLASLASGGSKMATKIWDILINNNNTNMKKNDYSKISIDSIHDSLLYYVESLKTNFEEDLAEQFLVLQKKHETMFANRPSIDVEGGQSNKICIELAEDSIVSISGFAHLLSSILKNLSDNSDRDIEIRNIAYQRFIPIISQYLDFDNLINGGKILQVNINSNPSNSPSYVDLPEIHVSDDSRVILLNLVFRLLGNFVENSNDSFVRYEIWRLLDRWMYHGLHMVVPNQNSNDLFGKQNETRKYTRKRSLGMIEVFVNNLTHYSQVLNFTDIVKKLLQPLGTANAFDKYTLAYPCDLGYGYRPNNQIGIWPYIEFLLREVFGQSHSLDNSNDRINLQTLVLSLCSDALREVDWRFLSHIAMKVIRDFKTSSFDTMFDSKVPGAPINYDVYVKLHHSLAIVSYFFENNICQALFKVINQGIDSVNSSSTISQIVSQALDVLTMLMEIQDTYKTYLLPVLKSRNIIQQPIHRNSIVGMGTSMSLVLNQPQSIFDNIYLAKSLGSQGVSSFHEIFLFHISSIVHVALFVSCENSISSNALKIVKSIASSPHFRNSKTEADPLLNNDRLLTTFQNIDESEKIKFAFIDKFEEIEDKFDSKFEILILLIQILDQSKNAINVAHFLLGYEIRGQRLFWNSDKKHNTFLETLLNTLCVSLNLISELDYNNGNRHVIDVGPAKLSSLILEVLIKLCKDPVSSALTMSLVREYNDLIEKLISFQPKLDLLTLWCGYEFNGDLAVDVENKFLDSLPSIEAFISFINQRDMALKLLSIELYSVESVTKKQYYTSLLIDKTQFPSTCAKILDFLDVLNYIFHNFEIEKYDYLNRTFDMSLVLEEVAKPNYQFNYSILKNVFRILCQGSNLITPEAKQSFSEEIMIEGIKIHEFVTKFLVMTNSREVQLSCLQSWCQLMKILIIEEQIQSSDFIIEVFNSILPKISAYLESDVTFSEELISLCVSLFDLYSKKFLAAAGKNVEENVMLITKVMPLFHTCVSGIISSNSTPNLRAELYTIFNSFLLVACTSESSLSDLLMRQIKAVSKKFFPVISNDLSYSEGLARINAIFALESLLRLGYIIKTEFVLENMVKTNFLSQMLRSIRRTDEVIKSTSKEKSDFSFNDLFVELTAFKAVLYLLVKIAQTKVGALQLIQSELFATLKHLQLLKIDPDLGLNLYVSETRNLKSSTIKVLLDTPLSLTDLVNPENIEKDENTLSYFDLVIPIFELITTVLLAMGPNYKPGIVQTKSLMEDVVKQLVVGVLKRDYLLDANQVSSSIYKKDSQEIILLKKLVHLFTVINSLIK
ncbi:NUP192 [Candida oxycetoniae]|uniref:NUP192 n=1 Tax=Candida oxycetoniae TaxID=497107 RepID=A0AAI9SXD2_9ASCO|nr:NUP192 [Candida oxycetoniae]KAI3404461.2 NUP192 [Candida oxycetoniae]